MNTFSSTIVAIVGSMIWGAFVLILSILVNGQKLGLTEWLNMLLLCAPLMRAANLAQRGSIRAGAWLAATTPIVWAIQQIPLVLVSASEICVNIAIFLLIILWLKPALQILKKTIFEMTSYCIDRWRND